ncbi:MAG: hypothetical protein FJZ79_07290 [Chlorobi bacterium]|nr:hypothetical protein [Chlorobiota bacterium]
MKGIVRMFALAVAVLALSPAVPAVAGGFFDNPLMQLIGGGDGDGIPNGQDPDYIRPLDGSGNGSRVVSARGAGVCDGTGPKGQAPRAGKISPGCYTPVFPAVAEACQGAFQSPRNIGLPYLQGFSIPIKLSLF